MKIRPNGWIRSFLETQLTGLTGHIEEAGYPFDTVCWGEADYASDNENPQWWVYEQTAYWLDGMLRCAIALEDANYLNRAQSIIYNVLDQADPDGYLGPKFLKVNNAWNRWPHVVFFRACMALYEYNQDVSIVEKMTAHYLNSPADYTEARDVLNVEIMLWLYGKTGNSDLLRLAEASYAGYNRKVTSDLSDEQALSDRKPYAHGVSYNEYFKLGAILYSYTGKETYLTVSRRAYEKLDDWVMLPSGCHCSNEFLISNHYMQSSETCDVTDYTWALSYLLDATGEGGYADRIEKCVFNAGIGAVLEDFKGLQYFSCANQILADRQSNHNTFFCGSAWMSYRPNPGTECCPGNVNRFMPNYVFNSWRQKGDHLYSRLYVSGSMETEISGKPVSICVETNYPFNETIHYHVSSQVPFTLHLRIPGWAKKGTVKLDGRLLQLSAENGFAAVQVPGSCCIVVELDSEICTHRTGSYVYFSKGPLVYSLGMKGRREIDTLEPKSSPEFPAYNMYPDRQWRYCIAGEPVYIPCEDAAGFDLDGPLPCLEVPAEVISNWNLEHRTRVRNYYNLYEYKYNFKKGSFVFTPRLLSNRKMELLDNSREIIRLYPYGACKLRMTVFNWKPSRRK